MHGMASIVFMRYEFSSIAKKPTNSNKTKDEFKERKNEADGKGFSA